MLKTAGTQGIFNFDLVFKESLIAFKRAGASGILTYGALEIAKKLN